MRGDINAHLFATRNISNYRGAVFGGESKNTIPFPEIPQGERDLRILFYLIKKLILWRGKNIN